MPDWKPEIRRRLASLRLAPVREAAIVEELAQDLDDCYVELISGGATEAEAYQQTLAELSSYELLARELRRAEWQMAPEPIVLGTNRRTNMIVDLWQDLRYGARVLLKQPGFTLIAVITLALGIGVNTSIFTLFHSLALRPLPVKDPEQIVSVLQTFKGEFSRQVAGNIALLSYPEYLSYRDRTRAFSGLVAYRGEQLSLGGSEAERIRGLFVTDNYFFMLGAETALGRGFATNECQMAGACPIVVLSHGFWQRRFGSDPEMVGKKVTLNRQPFTVVGIAARTFRGMQLEVPDVWIPLMMRGQLIPGEDFLPRPNCSWLDVVGRLKPDVPLKQAQVEMSLVAGGLDLEYPGRKTAVSVAPATYLSLSEARGSGIPVLTVLMMAVGLVLLIACANVSNLLLARAVARQKEIGVRLALGASRGRLIRQLLTESLLLACSGGAGGLLLTFWIPRVFLTAIPGGIALDVSPNLSVFGYCFLVSLTAGVVFGLAPALEATRLNLTSALKAEGAALGQHSTFLRRSRLRNLLVITQIVVSFLLLIGSGLLVRHLQRALATNHGFDPRDVLVLSFDLSSEGYDAPRAAVFYQQLGERLNALPGVKSVSLASNIPLMRTSRMPIVIEGREDDLNRPGLVVTAPVKAPFS